MSWFARSIANTFNLDDDEQQQHQHSPTDPHLEPQNNDSSRGGVKEDLSEITKTLTTKLWGVASFLAPPPSDHPPHSDPEPVSGIRRDFAEIGGRFRSGISKLSSNIHVSEITKLATNILQLSPEDAAEAIGVTDEVLAFVRDVTMHPDTWIEFPIDEDEDDAQDFELSDAQQEHALAVESLVPRLAALRIELCPGYMSESSFWKIYFVLLHPRLEPQAAELLSTPEIVKARASLTHELKARSDTQTHDKHSSVPSVTQSEAVPLEVLTVEAEKTEKHHVPTEELQIVDKSVIQEEPRNETRPESQKVPSKTVTDVVEDKDEDDWLKEDTSENVNVTGTSKVPIDNDEDVSFSDLEDDDDGDAPTSYTKTVSRSLTADHAGQKDSDGWLDVDDIDVA
ncbi:putative BSD domain-containing protein [Helianthus annuus]|nr:putative BSD domain-containing protein [Helianthus annuus]